MFGSPQKMDGDILQMTPLSWVHWYPHVVSPCPVPSHRRNSSHSHWRLHLETTAWWENDHRCFGSVDPRWRYGGFDKWMVYKGTSQTKMDVFFFSGTPKDFFWVLPVTVFPWGDTWHVIHWFLIIFPIKKLQPHMGTAHFQTDLSLSSWYIPSYHHQTPVKSLYIYITNIIMFQVFYLVHLYPIESALNWLLGLKVSWSITVFSRKMSMFYGYTGYTSFSDPSKKNILSWRYHCIPHNIPMILWRKS